MEASSPRVHAGCERVADTFKGTMLRLRHAKIDATLGPASSDGVTIRALFDAGADVFRLNVSRGTHAQHRERLERIRRVEREAGRSACCWTCKGPSCALDASLPDRSGWRRAPRFDSTSTLRRG